MNMAIRPIRLPSGVSEKPFPLFLKMLYASL